MNGVVATVGYLKHNFLLLQHRTDITAADFLFICLPGDLPSGGPKVPPYDGWPALPWVVSMQRPKNEVTAQALWW